VLRRRNTWSLLATMFTSSVDPSLRRLILQVSTQFSYMLLSRSYSLISFRRWRAWLTYPAHRAGWCTAPDSWDG
jgi:hypothetical protein